MLHETPDSGSDNGEDTAGPPDPRRLQVHGRVPSRRWIRGKCRILHHDLRSTPPSGAQSEPSRRSLRCSGSGLVRRGTGLRRRLTTTTLRTRTQCCSTSTPSNDFLAAVAEAKAVRMAFIVTDDDRGFQTVCGEAAREDRSRPPLRVVPHELHDQHGQGMSRAVRAEGLPGGRPCRGAGPPRESPRRLDSMALPGSLLPCGNHRIGQDGDRGGRDRGVVLRQPRPRFRARPGRRGAVVHRRSVAERTDSISPARRRRPDRGITSDRDREHIQSRETGTRERLLPQCAKAGKELATGAGNADGD